MHARTQKRADSLQLKLNCTEPHRPRRREGRLKAAAAPSHIDQVFIFPSARLRRPRSVLLSVTAKSVESIDDGSRNGAAGADGTVIVINSNETTERSKRDTPDVGGPTIFRGVTASKLRSQSGLGASLGKTAGRRARAQGGVKSTACGENGRREQRCFCSTHGWYQQISCTRDKETAGICSS